MAEQRLCHFQLVPAEEAANDIFVRCSRKTKDVPVVVPFISFAWREELSCSKLLQPFSELACGPVESITGNCHQPGCQLNGDGKERLGFRFGVGSQEMAGNQSGQATAMQLGRKESKLSA